MQKTDYMVNGKLIERESKKKKNTSDRVKAYMEKLNKK